MSIGGTPTTISSNQPPVGAMVDWQVAPETFLNILSSPRTQNAFERAIREGMEAEECDPTTTVASSDDYYV